MPPDALLLKIQRELCHPKCTRKVSGLSRNRPLVFFFSAFTFTTASLSSIHSCDYHSHIQQQCLFAFKSLRRLHFALLLLDGGLQLLHHHPIIIQIVIIIIIIWPPVVIKCLTVNLTMPMVHSVFSYVVRKKVIKTTQVIKTTHTRRLRVTGLEYPLESIVVRSL